MPLGSLDLVCPRCRRLDERGSLVTARLETPDGRAARLGALVSVPSLRCPGCFAAYPVIEGVPIVFRSTDAVDLELGPLTAPAETLVAALTSHDPERPLARAVARVARWAWAGARDWMDDASREPFAGEEIHAVAVMRWLRELGALPAKGAVLGVLGSGIGREAWESPADTLLLDANLPTLLLAGRLLRDGRAAIPMPRDAVRWRVAALEVPSPPRAAVGLLCADASDPPLMARSLGCVVAANLVDSVADPALVLRQACAAVSPSGHFALTSPFAWRSDVTPRPRWLESLARRPDDGAEDSLSALVRGEGLEVRARRELTWTLRANEREASVYRSVGLVFSKG